MIDQVFVVVGVLAGLALHMRARGVARVLPALALLLAAASRFVSLPLPAMAWSVLTGAAALVAVVGVMK